MDGSVWRDRLSVRVAFAHIDAWPLRLLTFRGDIDAAWKQAATFLEREILQQDVFKQSR
jgi:hypothetical protein